MKYFTQLAFSFCVLFGLFSTSNVQAQEAVVGTTTVVTGNVRLESLKQSIVSQLDILRTELEALRVRVIENRDRILVSAQQCPDEYLLVGFESDGTPICEYYPSDVNPPEPPTVPPTEDPTDGTYSWYAGEWSECDAECDGTQTRTVQCHNEDAQAVATDNCNPSLEPAASQTCSTSNSCVVTETCAEVDEVRVQTREQTVSEFGQRCGTSDTVTTYEIREEGLGYSVYQTRETYERYDCDNRLVESYDDTDEYRIETVSPATRYDITPDSYFSGGGYGGWGCEECIDTDYDIITFEMCE